ncbi:hypothetical protein JW964_04845 [candidate division KSB1 bacterium]|nr:hypothetical protein [candidate division KSB1 bacterium]
MKKLQISLIILFQVTLLFSQEQPLRHGLGFAAGMLSGSGFSYRQINQKYGFQVTFGLLSYHDNSSDFSEETYTKNGLDADLTYLEERFGRETKGNIGLMIYRILNRAEHSLFYAMIGVGNYFSSVRMYRRDYKYFDAGSNLYLYKPVSPTRNSTETDITTYMGLGLGLEWYLSKNIHLSIEWPLTVTHAGNIFMYVPQAGIHYYFK